MAKSRERIQEGWIRVGDCRTHYLRCGETGQNVMLLHGGSSDSARVSWGGTIPSLATDQRVIAPDLPGYGESAKPLLAYSIEYYVRVVQEMLDGLEIERTSLVGFSMGGFVALAFALKFPARVGKLVLVDSAGLHPRIPFAAVAHFLSRAEGLQTRLRRLVAGNRFLLAVSLSYIARRKNFDAQLIQEVFQEANRPGAGRAWRIFLRNEVDASGFRRALTHQLHRVQQPTLLIHGALDRLVPLQSSRLAHERIPQSHLHVIDDCGHWPSREKPAEFNRVLGSFLREA